MSEPLDELYFTWLCRQVGEDSSANPSRTYWRMLKGLYTKEFVYLIPNDDNRAADGKDLRREFARDLSIDIDPGWMGLGCSMFELMIGLARDLSELTEEDIQNEFWELVENLNLEQYHDNVPIPPNRVSDVLDEVIWRTYRRNGRGGLFPLKGRPAQDQTKVELWYQLNAYAMEKS